MLLGGQRLCRAVNGEAVISISKTVTKQGSPTTNGLVARFRSTRRRDGQREMGSTAKECSSGGSTAMLEARSFIEADVPKALAFLENRADAGFLMNNLVSKGIIDNSEPYQATYSGIWNGDTCQGVFAHCWNGMLLLSIEAALPQKVVATAAKQALTESPKERVFGGLIGTPEATSSALRALGLEKTKSRLSKPEVMLRCPIQELVWEKKGKVRRACLEDLEVVTDMIVGLEVEALNETNVDRAATKEDVRFSIEKTKYRWVLEVDGLVVSTCCVSAKVRNLTMVGGVYTPKEQRCKGYARAVVAGMLKAVAAEEPQVTTCMLFTNTPAALRAYRAIGFKDCGSYMLHFFEEPVSTSTLN